MVIVNRIFVCFVEFSSLPLKKICRRAICNSVLPAEAPERAKHGRYDYALANQNARTVVAVCDSNSIHLFFTGLVHGKPNGSDRAINNSSQSTQLSRGTKGGV